MKTFYLLIAPLVLAQGDLLKSYEELEEYDAAGSFLADEIFLPGD